MLIPIFLLMTMIGHLKLPENNYNVTAPGAHIFLVYDDARSFEFPIRNNHSVTAPSAQISLSENDAQFHCTTCQYFVRI